MPEQARKYMGKATKMALILFYMLDYQHNSWLAIFFLVQECYLAIFGNGFQFKPALGPTVQLLIIVGLNSVIFNLLLDGPNWNYLKGKKRKWEWMSEWEREIYSPISFCGALGQTMQN